MKINAPGQFAGPAGYFNRSSAAGFPGAPQPNGVMGLGAPMAAAGQPHNKYLPAPPTNLPSLAQVPTAQGPAGAPQMDPTARAALLQAMIAGAKQPTGMFPVQPPGGSAPTNVRS